MNFLLDTDTISHILKRNSPHHKKLLDKLQTYSPKQISVSIFTICELYFGLGRIDKQKKEFYNQLKHAIQQFSLQIQILEISENFALYYGCIRSELVNCGKDIGVIDCMLAAQAMDTNSVLVTHNLKHFQRIIEIPNIPKLKLLDWIE